ncbi:MAG: class I SAM-dependent methyltransferase [Bryobacterales bacterium]|nr:class I SAM-dependent methyltransferase [Bryobacterales bacterium]
MNPLPGFLSRSPRQWIDGIIPAFAPDAESLYDRRPGTVDIYTGIAYGLKLFQQQAAEPLYSRFAALLGKDSSPRRILDIGCGPARIAYDVSPALPQSELVCVDISKEMVHRAWQILVSGQSIPLPAWDYRGRPGTVFRNALRQQNVWIAQADALDLPFYSQSFDTITAALLLCRVSNPLRAIDEMARVLRPGGQLILATPFAFNDPSHWQQFWPPTELQRVLAHSGFAMQQSEDGIPYEEIIDANGNSHRYRVSLCVAHR